MVDTTPVLEMFEKKFQRILWLPALTLGYIYHLSGAWPDFGLAVAAIVGGRYFINLIDSWVVEDENLRLNNDATAIFRTGNSVLTNTTLAVVNVLYVVAAVYGAYRLEQVFTHTDPVLVGLGVVYWSVGLIVFLPKSRTAANTALDTD